MRELKFRTWDKNRQSFIGPVNLLGDQKYVVLPENWPWENYCEAVNLSTLAKTLEEAAKQRNEYARENWIVQQWTGLSDVKDDDIYEGDIVMAHNYNYPYDVLRCVVEFSQHSASFFLRHVKESNISLNFSHCGSKVNTEIIGNIFEDARLLG